MESLEVRQVGLGCLAVPAGLGERDEEGPGAARSEVLVASKLGALAVGHHELHVAEVDEAAVVSEGSGAG